MAHEAVVKGAGLEDAELSGGPLVVSSPIDGGTLAQVAVHSPEDVDAMVAKASDAFRSWRQVPAPRRGEFVRLLRESGGLDRTVIVAATSDQSALVKRRAAELTMETAEYFRDLGRQVLCLFDSVTRFAEAHREIALAAGEPPALRAFPPSTTPAIAKLCERAGPGVEGSRTGDITAIFTVLVSGSDMEEPVADMVRGILDGHVVLDREIAERGRFPAINLRRSVSRSAPAA